MQSIPYRLNKWLVRGDIDRYADKDIHQSVCTLRVHFSTFYHFRPSFSREIDIDIDTFISITRLSVGVPSITFYTYDTVFIRVSIILANYM
jgi:hypothetical protein